MWPNQTLQRTRPSHHCCKPASSWAGSLSLGRWADDPGGQRAIP